MIDIKKQQVGGIIFFQTKILKELNDFYIQKLGCSLWLDQGECQVYQFGNMLFGFCQRESVDYLGMISFNLSSREEVDQMFLKFTNKDIQEPKDNSKYRIYHFYTKDPENRNIEFQYFWDE